MPNDKFAKELKENGIKITKQRKAILNILSENDQPMSAEQIFLSLSGDDSPPSLSTVYRSLDILAEKDIITKLSLSEDNKALYEINSNLHRHYLCCLGCSKIIPISKCPLEDYEQTLAEETGFEIAMHKLNVYGYCPDCKAKGDS